MFKLPELGYAYNALEPYIDAKTMEIHHSKHHQAYVDKLNAALKDNSNLQNKPIEELIKGLNSIQENTRTAVRNHGGGHLNHTFLWQVMGPGKGGEPSGEVLEKIKETFESFEKLKEAFSGAALKIFGSGWVWLVVSNGKLEVLTTPNQDSPVTQGKTPILGLDMWEHAMYLKFQNRKLEYIQAWWNVVNWDKVLENLVTALK